MFRAPVLPENIDMHSTCNQQMQFKYAGEKILKDTPLGGLEQVPVGWYRSSGTEQGGWGSRQKRRATREAMFSMNAMQPMQPMAMQPGMQPMMGQPMMMQPVMMPMQPMVGQATQEVWQKKPWTPKPEWPKKRAWWESDWGQQAKAPPSKQPWKEWPEEVEDYNWRKDQEKDNEKNKEKEWPSPLTPRTEAAIKMNKTARLLWVAQVAVDMGKQWKDCKLQWCEGCHKKNYLGANFCITPFCRLPEQYRLLEQAQA